jgi:hypothetical protein
MSKPYTQNDIENMTDNEIYDLICMVANDVNNTLDLKRTINGQINEVMRNNRLQDNLMLRRYHDGVTEARWMVRKMIGELLATGKANI